jgi:hypothetical protein
LTVRAELVTDAGASSASTGDFFRSEAFLAAEGVTHTLRIGEGISLPLIVREIPGAELRDGISPYGYPGATVGPRAASPDPSEVDWSGTGLVSAFIRDRIGADPFLGGATERSRVYIHDPAKEPGIRPRLTEQIRANERRGFALDVASGPDSSASQRAGFMRAYDETMRRAGAAERYLYPAAYFEAILSFERSWLLVATASGEAIAAGAIAALSDGVLHYYLGGTADAHRSKSPFKNVVAGMMALAGELRAPLNLGGGVAPGDGLERFKRGFANASLPFHTHELVLDQAAYGRLSLGCDVDPGFFPAYRR